MKYILLNNLGTKHNLLLNSTGLYHMKKERNLSEHSTKTAT